jgi:CDP-paratose 2-epimerase
MKMLITGGAGFVGSALARHFKSYYQDCDVTAFDNLKRRGSELNLPGFKTLGIRFVHGDIRTPADFMPLGDGFDLIVDASAEPSVHAGTAGPPDDVFHTNLTGTFNCLNFARDHADKFLFLSTSRVYSIAPLREIQLVETATRFEIAETQMMRGVTSHGISETFTTESARSFYGATKLSAEILLQEFVATYGMSAVIYRCGVIAGPGQFGKADQGVFTLWLANHYFGLPLTYIGFGGTGKQLRDLLHPLDLAELVCRHLPRMAEHRGQVFNVGGGRDSTVSLAELTEICKDLTGRKVPIGSRPETTPVDVPLFITDCTRMRETVGWQPARGVETIFRDTLGWIQSNESMLRGVFC